MNDCFPDNKCIDFTLRRCSVCETIRIAISILFLYKENYHFVLAMSLQEFLLYTPGAFVASSHLESTQSYQALRFSNTRGFWYNVLIYAAMFILLTTGYSVQFFQRLIPTLKIVRDKELGNFICQVTGTVNCFYISLTSVVAIWRLYYTGNFVLGVSLFLSVW